MSVKENARSKIGTHNGKAVSSATTASDYVANIFNAVVSGTGTDDSVLEEYIVNNIFVHDGNLRIGFKNIGTLDNNWHVADDFQLIYKGNDNAIEGYQGMLKYLVDEAKTYTDLIYSDLQVLNTAITSAESFLTSQSTEEILSAVDALQASIDVAKEASQAVVKFKSGSYKTVADYDNDDIALLDIATAMKE